MQALPVTEGEEPVAKLGPQVESQPGPQDAPSA